MQTRTSMLSQDRAVLRNVVFTMLVSTAALAGIGTTCLGRVGPPPPMTGLPHDGTRSSVGGVPQAPQGPYSAGTTTITSAPFERGSAAGTPSIAAPAHPNPPDRPDTLDPSLRERLAPGLRGMPGQLPTIPPTMFGGNTTPPAPTAPPPQAPPNGTAAGPSAPPGGSNAPYVVGPNGFPPGFFPPGYTPPQGWSYAPSTPLPPGQTTGREAGSER